MGEVWVVFTIVTVDYEYGIPKGFKDKVQLDKIFSAKEKAVERANQWIDKETSKYEYTETVEDYDYGMEINRKYRDSNNSTVTCRVTVSRHSIE